MHQEMTRMRQAGVIIATTDGTLPGSPKLRWSESMMASNSAAEASHHRDLATCHKVIIYVQYQISNGS